MVEKTRYYYFASSNFCLFLASSSLAFWIKKVEDWILAPNGQTTSIPMAWQVWRSSFMYSGPSSNPMAKTSGWMAWIALTTVSSSSGAITQASTQRKLRTNFKRSFAGINSLPFFLAACSSLLMITHRVPGPSAVRAKALAFCK